jgi:hypothetical protein
MSEEKNTFVNVDFANFPELLKNLEKMVEDDGMNRSQFIRKLVRQEIGRREQAQLPLPFPEQPKRRKNDTHAAQTVAA